MYLQKVISRKLKKKKNSFLMVFWRSMTKITGSGSASGSATESGSGSIISIILSMDPEHCLKHQRKEADY
jgi:hypothetical protein